MLSGILDEPDSESAIYSSLVNTKGVSLLYTPLTPHSEGRSEQGPAGSNPALAFSDTLNRTNRPVKSGHQTPPLACSARMIYLRTGKPQGLS